MPSTRRLPPSALALLAANAVPLVGALFFGWSVGAILGLYWAESGVVAFYTVLKIATSRAEEPIRTPKAFLIPFFVVHFGIFMLVHGGFVLVIAAATARGDFAGADVQVRPDAVAGSVLDLVGAAAVAVIALLFSHGFSFVANYLGRGENRRLSPRQLMFQPYRRIVVMHLTLMAGCVVAVFFGTPPLVVAILVAIKTAADLRQHLREHAVDTMPVSTLGT